MRRGRLLVTSFSFRHRLPIMVIREGTVCYLPVIFCKKFISHPLCFVTSLNNRRVFCAAQPHLAYSFQHSSSSSSFHPAPSAHDTPVAGGHLFHHQQQNLQQSNISNNNRALCCPTKSAKTFQGCSFLFCLLDLEQLGSCLCPAAHVAGQLSHQRVQQRQGCTNFLAS